MAREDFNAGPFDSYNLLTFCFDHLDKIIPFRELLHLIRELPYIGVYTPLQRCVSLENVREVE